MPRMAKVGKVGRISKFGGTPFLFIFMKINTRIFEIVEKNNIIEVWMPPVSHSEGELILTINKLLLPQLISVLKNYEQSQSHSR